MMAEKTVIYFPPKKRVGNKAAAEKVKKLRVAAYCRVSTDTDEQATSYDEQVDHYTEYIKKNPDWTFAGIYADDGISGTGTKKREEFLRMIDDCMAGKIDLVVTKSISRFARNTIDCLKYIRQLKAKNIPVIFEKENINTMDSKGEVLITIMASLAQQESESLSKNVKLGLQFRYQRGKVQVNHNWFLGYTKDKDGNLVIDPEQAETVKRIYKEYLEGKSCKAIAEGLMADGIPNGAGSTKWWDSNILQILKNEKYMGDALLQKTYTVSLLDKKRAANNGEMPKYYVDGSHEAIIDRDVFMKVKAEIALRTNLNPDGKRRVYSSKYALSGMVFCGHCGDIYRRVKWNNRGCKSTLLRCVSRVIKKDVDFDCLARTVREEVLQGAIVTAANDAYARKNVVMALLKQNIESTVFGDLEERLAMADKELADLQAQMIAMSGDDAMVDALGEQIDGLRAERQSILTEAADCSDLQELMNDMIRFLDEMPTMLTEYNDAITRRLVEKIMIYDEKIVLS